jgi:two-component system KDP operon response regulator KdpE
MSGLDVLKRFREWSETPVLILTVQDAEAEKIAALDSGADDYVTKPFNTGELLARLRAALRHADKARGEDPVFQSGDLVVDLVARQVTRGGQPVLHLFIRHAGKVLTHRQILREVWGPGHEEHTHYLRVYLAHLREKLEANPAEPELFITEPGVGYRLRP